MNQMVTRPEGRSVVADLATSYGMDPVAFERTVRATCMKGANVTPEEFAAFLLVARQYSLNPILKEIYAFPAKGGGIQPIVSVDGWSNLINSHAAFDGLEFEDHMAPNGDLTAITCRIYRKDRGRAITATEYMAECRRNTDVWRQWPRRMLRHKAMIQAARIAFGFSGIYDPDEVERAQEEARTTTGLKAALANRQAAQIAAPVDEGFSVAVETIEGELASARETVVTTEYDEALAETIAEPVVAEDEPDHLPEPMTDGGKSVLALLAGAVVARCNARQRQLLCAMCDDAAAQQLLSAVRDVFADHSAAIREINEPWFTKLCEGVVQARSAQIEGRI